MINQENGKSFIKDMNSNIEKSHNKTSFSVFPKNLYESTSSLPTKPEKSTASVLLQKWRADYYH